VAAPPAAAIRAAVTQAAAIRAAGVTIAFPDGVLLKPSLKNGFVVGVGVDQAATLTGKLILGKKLAKKYGLGSKAVVIAKDSVKNAGPDSLMEFKLSKAIRKKLKSAKSLKLILEVVATRPDGTKVKESETLKLV
jgi:hypothetical protein